MRTITTLLCGAALAVAATSPVLAGGKSTTGSVTTTPTVTIAPVFFEVSQEVRGVTLEDMSGGDQPTFIEAIVDALSLSSRAALGSSGQQISE